jgi:hypothetical protein
VVCIVALDAVEIERQKCDSPTCNDCRLRWGNPISTGCSNFEHQVGRARAGTLAEQLILHDCVVHGSRPLLLAAASGAAAARAAGDDNKGGPGEGAVCGATGPVLECGSFLKNESLVAHPASVKTSKAAAGLIVIIR